MKRALTALAAVLAFAASPALAQTPDLTVEGTQFVLNTDEGVLRSADLVGAEMDVEMDGQDLTLRIDSVEPDKEAPSVLLHDFKIKAADGSWQPLCQPDAYGRTAGFPVAGRFEADGTYVKDAASWFLTCTSGSQGKCILYGYNPWGKGPKGEPLDRLYQACQQMVRADYFGDNEPHTKDGTMIDIQDVLGIQVWATLDDKDVGFEAGWGPDGAVCVARTRWPELLTVEALEKAKPGLTGCDPETAKAKGALLFTRVKIR